MSTVLYRQYRPQRFAEVVNQDHIKRTLKNAVAGNMLAHAYLFTGPRGVGKTSFARILAKAANCLKNSSDNLSPRRLSGEALSSSVRLGRSGGESEKGDACDTCSICIAIREGRFLDLIEIDAASNTGVDNVRELIEHVKFSPTQGRYKVIVIDEVHMLSKGAFNALLKTLEEPPRHAVFILATTEITKVPATIVSRTQRFDFRRLSQADIVGHLRGVAAQEKIKAPEEVLKLVARASDGSMRDALSLFDQLISFSEDELTLEEAEQILGLTPFSLHQDFFALLSSRDLAGAVRLLGQWVEKGVDMPQFLTGFLEYVHLVLTSKILGEQGNTAGLTAEDYARVTEQAKSLSSSELVRLVNVCLSAVSKLKLSPLPELPLQLAAAEFIEGGEGKTAASAPKPARDSAPVINPAAAIPPAFPAEGNPPDALSASSTSNMSLEDISGRWGECVAKLREYNHSLISSLKLARLVSYDGGQLVIAFPYRFHKEAVEQHKNRIIIEKVLEEVYAQPVRLRCVLAEEVPAAVKPGNLLEEAMKVFGTS